MWVHERVHRPCTRSAVKNLYVISSDTEVMDTWVVDKNNDFFLAFPFSFFLCLRFQFELCLWELRVAFWWAGEKAV